MFPCGNFGPKFKQTSWTAVATSERSELIHGPLCLGGVLPPPNFFRLTLRFVNSACRPTEVGAASYVQLSVTWNTSTTTNLWHEETDCSCWQVRSCIPVFARLDVCACTSWSASVYLHQRQCSWWVVCWSVSPACACACVCQSVARSCVHVSLAWVSACVCCVYATINTCGNNATDEKLKKSKNNEEFKT